LKIKAVKFILGISFFCVSSAALGQSLPTASRQGDLSVFGTAGVVNPDYPTSNQAGYVFGLDYTRYFNHLYVVPSLELRASVSPKGAVAGQNVYGGGLKLEHPYGRFHPYADALVGVGYIRFRHPHGYTPTGDLYIQDLSRVYTFGGGLDVDLNTRFSIKLDAQFSNWKLNPAMPITLEPSIVGVGVTYHPFRPR